MRDRGRLPGVVTTVEAAEIDPKTQPWTSPNLADSRGFG